MKKLSVVFFMLLIVLSSCSKDSEDKPNDLIFKSGISGVVQKGPFLNGSTIEIYELDETLTPTGKSFSNQILDNSGLFELNDITLVSPYIQLKATGYYFNEITGKNSDAPVILTALADISLKTSVNVNALSHLAKSRIEHLVKTEGKTFLEAKSQAEQEVLAIFFITENNITNFEDLNISKNGEENAILLAISIMLQGFRNESGLSDLLANIITDIRQDGVLDNTAPGSAIINDIRLCDLQMVREHLEKRYSNLGINAEVPNFELYVEHFIETATYEITNQIEYPEFSGYGENLLFGDKTIFSSGLSIAAYLPAGTSLKIVIKGGQWSYAFMPNPPINWAINQYQDETQTFTAIDSDRMCDLSFSWMDNSTHIIEYYENNSETPTRIKTIVGSK